MERYSKTIHVYILVNCIYYILQVDRIGRWIDFDNDYKTLYPEFMESVWWVFKQLYSKGLVYHGQKVMPFSTACNTPVCKVWSKVLK